MSSGSSRRSIGPALEAIGRRFGDAGTEPEFVRMQLLWPILDKISSAT